MSWTIPHSRRRRRSAPVPDGQTHSTEAAPPPVRPRRPRLRSQSLPDALRGVPQGIYPRLWLVSYLVAMTGQDLRRTRAFLSACRQCGAVTGNLAEGPIVVTGRLPSFSSPGPDEQPLQARLLPFRPTMRPAAG